MKGKGHVTKIILGGKLWWRVENNKIKGKMVISGFWGSRFTKAAVGLVPVISGSSPSAGSSLLLRWFFNYQSTANGKILILYLSQALE